MAGEKFVSSKVARKRLWAAGLKQDDLFSVWRFVAVKKGVRQHDLEVVKKALKAIGAKNTGFLLRWFGLTSALKQLGKKRFSGLGLQKKGIREQFLFALEAFSPNLGRVLKNRFLARNGYGIILTNSYDAPFSFALEIEKNKKEIGRFNFDLFFNWQKKPSVMLGHLQGGSKKAVEEFKAMAGQSVLDFFLHSFKKAFAGQNRVMALNPSKHPYRVKQNMWALAASMQGRGKLTEKELEAYRENCMETIGGNSQEVQAVVEKVGAERQRIITETTGMHKAAYKKAGFGRTRSRTWRLQRKRG